MSKKLVAYFSASGVTAKVARTLAEAVGADLFEIAPKAPYTKADLNWMDANARSTVEMKDPGSRPELAAGLPMRRPTTPSMWGSPSGGTWRRPSLIRSWRVWISAARPWCPLPPPAAAVWARPMNVWLPAARARACWKERCSGAAPAVRSWPPGLRACKCISMRKTTPLSERTAGWFVFGAENRPGAVLRMRVTACGHAFAARHTPVRHGSRPAPETAGRRTADPACLRLAAAFYSR